MFDEWYLCRNSGSGIVVCYPTELTGIRAEKSRCGRSRGLMFKPITYMPFQIAWGMDIATYTCKDVFGHCPGSGKILYVKKDGDKWLAEECEPTKITEFCC